MSLYAGLALITLGLALRRWAQRELEGAGVIGWQDIHTPRRVVETGPYAWLSHPMYTGTVVSTCGLGIAALGWGGVVLGWAVIPTLAWRVRMEEVRLALARAGRSA